MAEAIESGCAALETIPAAVKAVDPKLAQQLAGADVESQQPQAGGDEPEQHQLPGEELPHLEAEQAQGDRPYTNAPQGDYTPQQAPVGALAKTTVYPQEGSHREDQGSGSDSQQLLLEANGFINQDGNQQQQQTYTQWIKKPLGPAQITGVMAQHSAGRR